MDGLMPWEPKTPQEYGKRVEKKRAKERGARVHPGSGSGRIKYDASTTETLYEFKEVAKSHTLKGDYLEEIFVTATRQGKDAIYVVSFGNGITLEGRLSRNVLPG